MTKHNRLNFLASKKCLFQFAQVKVEKEGYEIWEDAAVDVERRSTTVVEVDLVKTEVGYVLIACTNCTSLLIRFTHVKGLNNRKLFYFYHNDVL